MLRFYGSVNPMGSCPAQSVCLNTLLLGRLSPIWGLTSIVYNLSPETDNCPSCISGRQGENDRRKYFMINLHERLLLTQLGSNPQPPHHQSYAHPTEPSRPAKTHLVLFVCVEVLRPSQPYRVMSSVVSLPNRMFTGQA